MIFGVPKELPPFKDTPEHRVGLSPMGVEELVLLGAQIYVESNAGMLAGFSDDDYTRAGATIVYSKEEAYRRADVVLKVRRPQETEYKFFKEKQVIMGFMHLVTARKDFFEFIKTKKITLVGYEIIQRADGYLPIVAPMSRMAGKLAVQLAARLLESPTGGRGILLGGIPGIPPAEVVILGAGTLGCNAARSFCGVGANVYVLDIDREKLEDLAVQSEQNRITTMFATKYNLSKLVKFADVLIGAVLVPGKKSPILITADMVKTMRRGSVIIDFAIDQGGCVETAKIAPLGKFIYTVDEVVHFCMPNATTLVARTATHAITSAVFPYLKMMTEIGFERTLQDREELSKGLYSENGEIKQEYIA
jgi:alanine dehydrogenase